MQSTNEKYVFQGSSAAAATSYPWFRIDDCNHLGIQISQDSASGAFIFEATSLYNQLNPNTDPPTAGQIAALTLVAAEQTLATPVATAVNHIFNFAPTESTNVSALPAAKWMRVRSTHSAGGTATGLNIAITRKGSV